MNRLLKAIVGSFTMGFAIKFGQDLLDKRSVEKRKKEREMQETWFKKGWDSGYNNAMLDTENYDKIKQY